MARTSYVVSVRAMALGPQTLAWFCTAPWPDFTPPLTTKAMFVDAWEARLTEAHAAKESVLRQVKEVEKQIDSLLDRLVEAASPTVVKAYETRIEKLEREKLVLSERAVRALPPKGRLEEFIELSLTFLANPWNIWNNGSTAMRQAVLRLAFVEPLKYSLENGYRTPETAYPFNVLATISGQKCEMVL